MYFKMGRTTHDFILFSWASQWQVPIQASTTLHLLYQSQTWIPRSHHRLFPVSSPNYQPSEIRRAPGCFSLFVVVVVSKWYLKEFEKLLCDQCNKHITLAHPGFFSNKYVHENTKQKDVTSIIPSQRPRNIPVLSKYCSPPVIYVLSGHQSILNLSG